MKQPRSLFVTSVLLFLQVMCSYALGHFSVDRFIMQKIHSQCNHVSKRAILTSLTAYHHAREYGLDHKQILTIVDFTRPSTQYRLCTINMNTLRVLFDTYVTHGQESGGLYAKHFSNRYGSHESSIGVYLTGKSYYGRFGYAMRLYGLDEGFNSHAASRAIVFHSEPFINRWTIQRYHVLGETWGCFAVAPYLIHRTVNALRDGTLLVAYYPNHRWLHHSVFLRDTPEVATHQILSLIHQQV